MVEVLKYKGELEFLNAVTGDRHKQYRSAPWLHSEFEADTWDCRFREESSITVTFRISLSDGESLTSIRHRKTLDAIKCWLCVQTHIDATGGRVLAPSTARNKIKRTLHAIDYLLLNAQSLQIAEHGFALITENDISGMLVAIASRADIATSIYQWPKRLSAFLRQNIAMLSTEEFERALNEQPNIVKHLPPLDARMLELDDEGIILARAWLWTNNLYSAAPLNRDYLYSPNTERLASIIYENTLRGATKKPLPEELLLHPVERYIREFEAAPVRNKNIDRMSEPLLSEFVMVLRSVALLAQAGVDIPGGAFSAIDGGALKRTLELKQVGNFRTLPQRIVLKALRDAIEFGIEYGDDLITSYLTLITLASAEEKSCMAYANEYGLEHILEPKLRNLGVTAWTLITGTNGVRGFPRGPIGVAYYYQLRSNPGLWELLRVYFGAVQICVGTLMARRNGELKDLVSGQCLDRSESRLLFKNRKSGTIGLRAETARPIPEIAVRMIKQLDRLQQGLIDAGNLADRCQLFRYPNHKSNTLIAGLCHGRMYESLDFFCDYFNIELNNIGQRYYLRQHQLRRFFAMLFFWGRSFGGLDTLRWFLGHTDVEHLYHYITEETPGEVLRSVKANYGANLITCSPGDVSVEGLSLLLERRFGTRDFSVLDEQEVGEYLEDLLLDGTIEIEPEFFEAPDGKTFRIAVKITHAEPAADE